MKNYDANGGDGLNVGIETSQVLLSGDIAKINYG